MYQVTGKFWERNWRTERTNFDWELFPLVRGSVGKSVSWGSRLSRLTSLAKLGQGSTLQYKTSLTHMTKFSDTGTYITPVKTVHTKGGLSWEQLCHHYLKMWLVHSSPTNRKMCKAGWMLIRGYITLANREEQYVLTRTSAAHLIIHEPHASCTLVTEKLPGKSAPVPLGSCLHYKILPDEPGCEELSCWHSVNWSEQARQITSSIILTN